MFELSDEITTEPFRYRGERFQLTVRVASLTEGLDLGRAFIKLQTARSTPLTEVLKDDGDGEVKRAPTADDVDRATDRLAEAFRAMAAKIAPYIRRVEHIKEDGSAETVAFGGKAWAELHVDMQTAIIIQHHQMLLYPAVAAISDRDPVEDSEKKSEGR